MNSSRLGAILTATFVLAMSLGAVAAEAGPHPTIQSERWIPVGGSANLHEDYLDQVSIAVLGAKVTAWAKRESVSEHSTEWYELEFDCSMRTVTILAQIRNARGIISHSSARPHRAASPIHPGSVDDRSFKIVCRPLGSG
jgi:hypothetical protein